MLAAVVDWRAAACKLHLATLRAFAGMMVRLPIPDLRRVGKNTSFKSTSAFCHRDFQGKAAAKSAKMRNKVAA